MDILKVDDGFTLDAKVMAHATQEAQGYSHEVISLVKNAI
jgi:hypothetical protein